MLLSFSLTGEVTNNNIVFASLTQSGGLPSNTINCLYKDHSGFLWIGTSEGIARYDGHNRYTLYNMQSHSVFQSEYITAITEDDNHNLWIGTKFGGVIRFDQKTGKWTNYKFEKEDKNSLSNDEILHILCDSNNRVWIGTEDGLNVYDSDSDGFYAYKMTTEDNGIKSKAILKIEEDSKGNIWLGSWGSGLYLVLANDDFSDLKFRQIELKDDVEIKHVWAIEEIDENSYWTCTPQFTSRGQ